MTDFFSRVIRLTPRPALVLTVAGFLGLVMFCRPGPQAGQRVGGPLRAGVGVPHAVVPANVRPRALSAAVNSA
ncbi:hypothetical protein [Amycolatopsis sp.]|uniref:hypothetical protein n=1 Tax=Amycolatopsis sp. TaxID=37632 RepID=UPI002D7E6E48|nr:hypothetical protein [Amycolatopsis sp.]HET6709228.1 hypothetical protein [Amycolatopsis sp.]